MAADALGGTCPNDKNASCSSTYRRYTSRLASAIFELQTAPSTSPIISGFTAQSNNWNCQNSDSMETEHGVKKDNFSKGLLQSEELYKYVLETSVYPREPGPLKELRAVTASHPRAMMGTAPDAGQLIAMLLQMLNPKKTIEVGVFTGYSLLLTALSIPDDGKIIAIDINREAFEMGLPIIQKAGVQHKIDFIESQALPVLDKLLEDHENEESFDFAFVDADKVNYLNYHKRLLKLLKVGGMVIYDNTLWKGTVALPETSVPEGMKPGRQLTIEFNRSLAADPRIQISHAPLGDGITICRRIY